MDDILQLKITLQWTKPPIWRRVLVDKNTTFLELHYIIQIAMGWTNSHLHEFTVKGTRIGELNEAFDDLDFGEEKPIDASTVTLGSVVSAPKEKFEYVYDFGDDWRHLIQVEKFLPRDEKIKYPVCLTGKLNCPPEDCGGVPGFYGLLEILSNKRHPERKEMLEWLGGPYNPEEFDIKRVNEELASLEDYLKE
jgi:hypothetical protein